MTAQTEPLNEAAASSASPRSSTEMRIPAIWQTSGTAALGADINPSTITGRLDGETPVPASENSRTHVTRSNVPRSVAWKLYTSHTLSTWNSRSFEFGAVLFLASIDPQSLRLLSIYALIRTGSAIFLAPWVGRAIDGSNRLSVVRFSIVVGRAAVIISCVAFWSLYAYPAISSSVRWAIFTGLTVLSCVERPCSILNLTAIERDWVVVIAGDDEGSLRTLNARMRRIDLFCKLVGPLSIALINGVSTTSAIFVTLGINVLSIPLEYVAIAQIYQAVPALRFHQSSAIPDVQPDIMRSPSSPKPALQWLCRSLRFLSHTFTLYTQHPVFLPSLALSLLYLTVLSLGGQMVTYLLASGYNSFHIALVRTLSVIFELSATWAAPRTMNRIGPARAGIWFLNWQVLCLGVAVAYFWAEPIAIRAASGLVAGTILSRIGLWGYDLCAQSLIQQAVSSPHRGAFSSTEAALQNAFELLSYLSTIIWSHPAQFRYPVLISAIAVYAAALAYTVFLRRSRGHLIHVHTPLCLKGNKPRRSRSRDQSPGVSGDGV